MVELDLLRKYFVKSSFGTTVYQVEEQSAVEEPAGHIHLTRSGQPVQYYYVQPWPYDWRLRLEESVDYLAGIPSHPGKKTGFVSRVLPPYDMPPSLKEIIEKAQIDHPPLRVTAQEA